jgi:hypothetical protein
MKALLKANWFQYILTMLIISLIGFFLIGPEGIFYGPVLMALSFLQKLITAILTGRWI